VFVRWPAVTLWCVMHHGIDWLGKSYHLETRLVFTCVGFPGGKCVVRECLVFLMD
jgi:hypothetical protein